AGALRFATGAGSVTDLGAEEPGAPDPGEVLLVDRAGVACCRRWCWRQSAQSATRESTTDALVVVEGLHDAAERDVAAAREEIVALLAEFQPGATVTAHALP